ERAKQRRAPTEYARAMAVGIFSDDPGGEEPGMVVIVHRGQIFHLSISDAYTTVPASEAAIIFTGVLMNAYKVWQSEYERLLAYAKSVIEEQGPESGTGTLRSDMETNGPLSPDDS